MSETPAQEVYIPTDRADVDRTDHEERPRKYINGKKLRKRDSKGAFVYDVTVVSARYNAANHRWEYTLKDYKDNVIAGVTAERDLQ